MKNALILVAALAALPALAQDKPSFGTGTNGSSSGSLSTAQTAIENVGSPIINLPGANPEQRTEFKGNTAAQAATVFVNPPAADTCAMPGSGGSVQVVGAGAGLSIAGDASVRCEMRADVLNLKVTTGDMDVIKARQCMDAQMAEAYARAGKPCVDKRPQKTAEADPIAQVIAAKTGEPTDPYVRQRMGLPALR